jgi:glycosyltransferase involved in cell wall biosynthesis
MRMKLVLCLEYSITQYGGTEMLVAELICGLSARHDIVLVSADDAVSLARSSVAACVAEHIAWQTEPASIERAKMLAKQIARTKPDLVHFHFGGNYAWKTREFWKCPVVHVDRLGLACLSTNHGAFSIFEGYCWERRHFLIKLALLPPAWLSKQYVLAHLTTEIAVSQNNWRALRRWYWPLQSKFGWIYHSRIRENSPPPRNPCRRKVILCSGTIGPRKGQTFLVEAFCRLAPEFHDWQLVLIGREGDATMMRRIHELVAKYHLEKQIQVLGPRSDEDLRDWLKQSAIFALPSLYEGLGLSLQEALFYGCACVGTRCGGVTDLIQNGDNGLLVLPGEVAPLADALKQLMLDHTLRERFSARGPQSVLEKGMTADKMVQAYEQLYIDILKRHT